MKKSFLGLLWIAITFQNCRQEFLVPSAEVAIFDNPLRADTSPENFLLNKSGYQVTYRSSWNLARSVTWTLRATDLGPAERQNQFRPDASLPVGWTQVRTGDYTGTGFDRGHLCPSADRTSSDEANQETFLMTNIVPQSPSLNRGAWANLESFARELARADYVVHQWVGVYGTGGEGSQGKRDRIGPNIRVPARLFKILWAIPRGESWDSERAVALIADFPNAEASVQGYDWVRYLTSWEELNRRWSEGDLRAGLDPEVVRYWSGDWWDYRRSPVAVQTACQPYQGRLLYLGLEGGCFYRTEEGRKVYVEASRCRCETSM